MVSTLHTSNHTLKYGFIRINVNSSIHIKKTGKNAAELRLRKGLKLYCGVLLVIIDND